MNKVVILLLFYGYINIFKYIYVIFKNIYIYINI